MTDEVTRADQKRQDRLAAEKPKETEKPKEGPSQFDRVLEESKSIQRALPTTQTPQKATTEQAAQEAHRRDDRQKDDERREDKDKDKGKDQGDGEKRSTQGLVQGRVAAKGQQKDGRGGSGGEGRGGFAGGQKRSVASTQLKSPAKAITPGLHGKFAERLQASIAKGMAAPQMTQAVLNQLVQYVRIGINKMGDKEIQIDLHEKIFRGLKMRVTSREGKVGVHFMAADAQTRSVFEKNKDQIRDALEKKGILVEDIRVT